MIHLAETISKDMNIPTISFIYVGISRKIVYILIDTYVFQKKMVRFS